MLGHQQAHKAGRPARKQLALHFCVETHLHLPTYQDRECWPSECYSDADTQTQKLWLSGVRRTEGSSCTFIAESLPVFAKKTLS